MRFLPQHRVARGLTIWALVLLVAVGGYFTARKVALPAYRGWREARLNRMARDFLAQGNVSDALITVRRNLRDNQRNVETWRLAVAVAKAKDSPEVIYFLDHVVKLGGRLPDRLELARSALRYGYLRPAVDAIDGAGAEARDSAEFHELAAQVYQRAGRATAARLHLYSLVQLRPDDPAARLALAEAEFRDDRERPDLALRAQVARLAADPALRPRALALLLDDAIARRSQADAAKFAGPFAEIARTPAQSLLALQGFELGAPDRVAAYRKKLDKELANDPDGAAELIRYDARHDRIAEASAWFAALPEKTRAAPPVAQALAEALYRAEDWAALNRHLGAYAWGEKDYLREAYLAYVAGKTGRPADATESWKFAAAKAGESVPKLADLVARASDWGWSNQAAELMWRVFALMPRNDGVRDQLIAWERRHGNTANLNRLFARVAEADPEDRDAKNNLAYTSLLLGVNLTRAYAIARDLHRLDPANPYYTTTQSLALYKQGKPAEALALLTTLPPPALSGPERTVLLALFEATAGKAERVEPLLAGVPSARLLPEERGLMIAARGELARQEQASGRERKLFAQREENQASGRRGWLQHLPPSDRPGSAAIQAADTLFAAGDLSGLNELLRTGNWGPDEPLRLALFSYLARAGGDALDGRTQWRSALSAAGGDRRKLDDLAALAAAWAWREERLEALDRRFARDPTDPAVLAELLEYHRAAGRTAEMARVLGVYVSSQQATPEQWSAFAYYSMLCNQNLARAYVAAQKGYQDAPDQANLRSIYAFALWKQQRFEEAWKLLDHETAAATSIVPLPLLQAAVLADLKRAADALQRLKDYQVQNALPEEARLADSLRRRLTEKETSALSAL